MAAATLLAEALQLALAHKCWEPDVDIANSVPEVVRAQLTHITCTVFNLRSMRSSSLSAGSDTPHLCAVHQEQVQKAGHSRRQTCSIVAGGGERPGR